MTFSDAEQKCDIIERRQSLLFDIMSWVKQKVNGNSMYKMYKKRK